MELGMLVKDCTINFVLSFLYRINVFDISFCACIYINIMILYLLDWGDIYAY